MSSPAAAASGVPSDPSILSVLGSQCSEAPLGGAAALERGEAAGSATVSFGSSSSSSSSSSSNNLRHADRRLSKRTKRQFDPAAWVGSMTHHTARGCQDSTMNAGFNPPSPEKREKPSAKSTTDSALMAVVAASSAVASSALAIAPSTPSQRDRKRRPSSVTKARKKACPPTESKAPPTKPAPTDATNGRSRHSRRAASSGIDYNVGKMAKKNEADGLSALAAAVAATSIVPAVKSAGTHKKRTLAASGLGLDFTKVRLNKGGKVADMPPLSSFTTFRYHSRTSGFHCSIPGCRALAFVASSFEREKVRSGERYDCPVHLCRRCLTECGFCDEKAPIDPRLDRYLKQGDSATVGDVKVVDGSPEECRRMLNQHSFLFCRIDTGSTKDIEQQFEAFNEEEPWIGKFVNRGAFYTSSSSEFSQLVRKHIKVVDNVVTWMETEGGLELIKLWATFQDEADLRLVDHGDADNGQVVRAVITLGASQAEGGKTMTITNRDTGRWFKIEIPHGTILIMTKVGSGAQGDLYWHAVDGAEGTYSFCFDMRKKK